MSRSLSNCLLSLLLFFLPVYRSYPFSLELVEKGTYANSDNKDALHKLLQEVEAKLPASMKALLKQNIRIKFIKMDQQSELPLPTCRSGEGKAGKHVTYGFIHQGLSRVPDVDRVIYLNKNLIQEILLGENARSFPCQHGNFYRKAQAVLIHELTHLLSLELDHLKKGKKDKEIPELSCHGKVDGPTLKQDLKQFRHIINWRKGGLLKGFTQANANHGAGPDAHEYDDREEGMPVNMEYFLLDPEFSFRRPAVARVFNKLLNHVPFPEAIKEGKQNYSAPVTDQNNILGLQKAMVSLDPSKIYQIHYLLAGKGHKFQGLWGHSMFRIIMCDPKSDAVPGPQCLEDESHHLVFGFTAKVFDTHASTWKGVFGGYPTSAELTRYSDVKDKYTILENRELTSFPLHLDKEQKEMMVLKMLENLYEYTGDYKIFSENCATLANDLVKCSVPSYNGSGAGKILRPTYLRQHLQDIKLLDGETSRREKHEQGKLVDRLYAPAVSDQMRSHFDMIRELLPAFSLQKQEDYFDLAPEKRRELFQNVIGQLKENELGKKKVLYFFSSWENALNKQLVSAKYDNIHTLFETGKDDEEATAPFWKRKTTLSTEEQAKKQERSRKKAELYKTYQILNQIFTQAFAQMPSPSYGIPSATEFEKINSFMERHLQESYGKDELKRLNEVMAAFAGTIEELVNEDIGKINSSQENLDFFEKVLAKNPSQVRP